VVLLDTNLGEFFLEGLMEPSAPSPSVFHNGEGPLSPDNMVHSYISHMLLEENIDDQILCQYYDHPSLLQMQQDLAHILSSPSSSAKNSTINNGNSEGTESLLHGSSGDPISVSLGFDMGADVVGLLQMQQALAHILSPPSSSTKNSSINKGNSEGTEGLLHGSSGDPTRVSLGFDKGADVAGAFLKGMEEGRKFLPSDNKGADVVGAFFKGMQEGRQFLPRGNNLLKDDHMLQNSRESSDQRGFKKSCNRCEHLEEVGRCNKCEHLEEVGRISKGMMMMEAPEEIGMQMFDDMSLCGYETFIRDMEILRIGMNNKVVKNNRKGCSKVARDVVDLHTLLIHCAQAVDTSNLKIAVELLKQIKQHASATGDATQRLALCFSKGLEVRLVGTGSQVSKLLMAERPSAVEFRKAYSLYIAACSFNKVAHIFSTRSIMQTMVGKNRLHIVDYDDVNYEFQWADLIRLLANRNREGDPPEMKITAISGSQPRSCPSQWIEEQEHRLNMCASEFGIPFTFRVMTMKREEVSIENLNIDEDEVLVVNDIFNFSSLVGETAFFGDLSPRDTVLNNIRKMKPNIFIQSVLNCSHGTSFLSRFREALFCYSTMFDMLDAIVPRDSEQRLVLEQGMLGRWALNAIACDGVDLIDRPEKYRRWEVRNRRAGLRQLPLEPDIVKELKDMVKKHHHKNFLLSEDDQWLLQGWKGRILFAHSTWVADEASSE
jgi:hypothetical protein